MIDLANRELTAQVLHNLAEMVLDGRMIVQRMDFGVQHDLIDVTGWTSDTRSYVRGTGQVEINMCLVGGLGYSRSRFNEEVLNVKTLPAPPKQIGHEK